MQNQTSASVIRKLSVAAGCVLIILAAFFSVSLLLQFLGYNTAAVAGYAPAVPSFVLNPGLILSSVYGFSSVLLPLFLFASALFLFISGWSFRRGVYLIGSIIPFFTVALSEYIFRRFSGNGSQILSIIRAGIAFLSTGIVVAIEYILLGLLADMLDSHKQHRKTRADIAVSASSVSEDAADTETVAVSADSEADRDEALDVSAEAVPFTDPCDDSEYCRRMTEDERAWLYEDDDVSVSGAPSPGDPAAALAADDARVPEGACAISEPQNETPSISETTADSDKLIVPEPEPPIFLNLHWNDGDMVPDQIPAAAVDESDSEEEYELLPVEPEDDFDASDLINEDEERFLNDPFDEELEDIDDTIPRRENVDAISVTEDFEEEDTERPFAVERDGLPVLNDFAGDDLSEEEDNADAQSAEDEIYLSENLIDEDIFPAHVPVREADVPQFSETIESDVSDDVKRTRHEECPPVDTRPAKVPSKKRGVYAVPVDGVLTAYPDGKYWIIDDATRNAAVILKETLQEFKIEAEVMGIRKGPVITMFEILPAPGVRLNKIVALQDNIALRLAASSVRIVAPIPGKHAVGIEVPNKERAIVSFRELIETDIPAFKKMEIPVVLGKDITGEAKVLDLTTTPHLLIAGATGSGKSVCVNSMILSILYKRSPQDVRMILIDPKIVELKLYNDIPHLLTPVITEAKKAFQALQYCLCEMERRYALLDGLGVRDIKSYNRRIVERSIAAEKLPYIVVIIDEFADLMATTGKELESTVARLAAMSRAVGVHLVLATQRPSIDVITGLIKANIPTRIAFMVASKMDSRIIIDQVGAEKLLGKGDMLYASAVDMFPVRIQGTFVSEEEVENVVDYVKQYGEPEYIDEEIFFEDDEDETIDATLFSDGDDPLYEKALEIVLQAGKASASYIQRRLKIGYNRAARLVEEMELRGIVGPANGSKPRDVVHVPV